MFYLQNTANSIFDHAKLYTLRAIQRQEACGFWASSFKLSFYLRDLFFFQFTACQIGRKI